MTLEGKIETAQAAPAKGGSIYDQIMDKPADKPADKPVVTTEGTTKVADVPPGAVVADPAARNTVKVVTDDTGKAPVVVGDPSKAVVGDPSKAPVIIDDRSKAPVVVGDPSKAPVVIGDPSVKTAPGRAVENSKDCNWRPDYEMKSESAKRWYQAFQQRKDLPLQVNGQGQYEVAYGDDLQAIASRNMRMRNVQPTKESLQGEMSQIIALNGDRYPSLRCNPELIKTGWRLNLPNGSEAPVRAPERPNLSQAPVIIDETGGRATGPVVAERPRQVVVGPGGDRTVYNIDAREVVINNGVVQEVAPRTVARQPVIIPQREVGPYYDTGQYDEYDYPQVPQRVGGRTTVIIGGNQGPQWGGQQWGGQQWGGQQWGGQQWGRQPNWGGQQWGRQSPCFGNGGSDIALQLGLNFMQNMGGHRGFNGGQFMPGGFRPPCRQQQQQRWANNQWGGQQWGGQQWGGQQWGGQHGGRRYHHGGNRAQIGISFRI